MGKTYHENVCKRLSIERKTGRGLVCVIQRQRGKEGERYAADVPQMEAAAWQVCRGIYGRKKGWYENGKKMEEDCLAHAQCGDGSDPGAHAVRLCCE